MLVTKQCHNSGRQSILVNAHEIVQGYSHGVSMVESGVNMGITNWVYIWLADLQLPQQTKILISTIVQPLVELDLNRSYWSSWTLNTAIGRAGP